MPAPRETIWEMPELTPIKHRILRGYLERWLPDIVQQYERVNLVDCFSGPGEYTGGEIGSPLVAMDVLLRCIPDAEQRRKLALLCIDNDRRRCNHLYHLLNKLKQEQPGIAHCKYNIERGKFARVLNTRLTPLEKSQAVLSPTFAFIDPFGFSDTPLSIIARMLRHEQCDVLITFMYEEINRFLAHPKVSIQQHLTELFGTEQWRVLARTGCTEEHEQQLCDLYRTQLRGNSHTKYVCMFRLKNCKNITDYFLVFATHKRENLERMKDVFWEIDPTCGYSYSVYEHERIADQLNLFPPEPDYAAFTQQLLSHFHGTTMSICALEEYILAETQFRRKGYREHSLNHLELTSRITVRSLNPQRKPGEYTEDDLIHFL